MIMTWLPAQLLKSTLTLTWEVMVLYVIVDEDPLLTLTKKMSMLHSSRDNEKDKPVQYHNDGIVENMSCDKTTSSITQRDTHSNS